MFSIPFHRRYCHNYWSKLRTAINSTNVSFVRRPHIPGFLFQGKATIYQWHNCFLHYIAVVAVAVLTGALATFLSSASWLASAASAGLPYHCFNIHSAIPLLRFMSSRGNIYGKQKLRKIIQNARHASPHPSTLHSRRPHPPAFSHFPYSLNGRAKKATFRQCIWYRGDQLDLLLRRPLIRATLMQRGCYSFYQF